MIKAFISHSSAQKGFARELVDCLGRDYCKIDCYNFNPAYKTIDEIYKNIEESTVFVLLISKESLSSDWVALEINHAVKTLSKKQLNRFWPYIIDDTISIDDCPKWMREEAAFNLRKFKSPIILARDIEQKFMTIIWSLNPKQKRLETTMVGRNDDIAKFEEKYQSIAGFGLRSLIISGREGVGKETFARQCIQKIGYAQESVPYRISTKPHDNIEDIIVYLNMITRTYSEDDLEIILMKGPKEKSHTAVMLLNELYNTNTVVFINDDMSCVLPNRDIPDWLKDIICDADLNNQLGLFILVRKAPHSFIEVDYPQIAHIQLMPLTRKDRVKLFVTYIRAYGLEKSISEEDVSFFVDKLLQSPEQLIQAARALTTQQKSVVKRDIDKLIKVGDKKIQSLLDHFSETEERHLLIILSKIDFVSYSILEAIFEERIIEAVETLNELMEYGVVSTFGPSEQYFRLDHYLSDYIKRYRMSLPSDLENHMNDVLEKRISESNSITEDTSLYLYNIKRQILSGKSNKQHLLIPSIIVNTIVEVYNRQDYSLVIQICDSVLNDSLNYYEDIIQELHYWLCLALCRTQNERFFVEVRAINNKADYWFLQGFFQRIAKNFNKAEGYYMKALSFDHKMRKAKREMVTALLAQNKYQKALDIARENYEHDPDNSYQIHGYFRCLVRKKNPSIADRKMLEELMNAMRVNYSDKREELLAAMNIEFQAYIQKESYDVVYGLIQEAKRQFPKSFNIERAEHSYLFSRHIVTQQKVFDEDIS